MTEKWIQINGYSNFEVSSLGRIRNISLNYIHKPSAIYKEQYLIVSLVSDSGKRSTKYVHRLVAGAFIKKDDGKDIVNHKNRNRHDNRASNLEWVDNKRNQDHFRDLIKSAKIIKKYRKNEKITQADLASRIGVSVRTVQRWEKGEILIPAPVLKLLLT